jgi:hypothetical protein
MELENLHLFNSVTDIDNKYDTTHRYGVTNTEGSHFKGPKSIFIYYKNGISVLTQESYHVAVIKDFKVPVYPNKYMSSEMTDKLENIRSYYLEN